MIEEISIRGLGVIGEATVPLGAGLTVLTGETGAGKTMVITALGLLLGERADPQAVRAGTGHAVVEGRWRIASTGPVADRVDDAGGEIDDGELILGRSVSKEGRSRATLGGRSVPVGVLSEVGEHLVVVHGQSDQLRLRSAIAQREALDRFGGAELAAALSEYGAVHSRWRTAQGELDVLTAERDRRAREADGLRLAITEIERAAPSSGEDDALAERAEVLTNTEDLRLAASVAHEHLSSEEIGDPHDVLGLLDDARRQLERVAQHDPRLDSVVEAMREVSFLAVDAAQQVSTYLAGLDEESPRELETVQERRAVLGDLIRRYGPSLDDVIAYLETSQIRLLELDTDEEKIQSLADQVESDQAELVRRAARLTEVRTRTADALGEKVTDELAALAMPDARLVVVVSDRGDYTPMGTDQVAFLLRPHPGAEPRPLGRGASGGELSRVMLAIEVVIAGSYPVPTFIFDEVDTGVGGASAIEVGRRLATLATTSQVIVVTHLAQVAAFADRHLKVAKDSSGSITSSSVEVLDGASRTAEMARLLSGLPDSGTGLEHARELMETARELVR